MKRFIATLCAAFLPALSLLAQAPDLTKLDIVERHTPDGPVALVDGSPITNDTFLQLYHARMDMLGKDLPSINDAVRIKTAYQSIGDLIKREILYVEAKKRGLIISDAAVEARLKESFAFQAEQAQKAGGTPLTEAELLAESGKTRAELLDSVRKSMLIEKMEDEIAAKDGVKATQAEIKAFYDTNPQFFRKAGGFHLQQIFIQPKPSATDATEEAWDTARKAIEKGLSRIRAGESFEAVARDISESRDRQNGGDMGVVPSAELPDFVVATARTLKVGELSNVVKSGYGYHIFKLLGVEKEEALSLAEATPRIKAALEEAGSVNAVEAYVVNIMQDTSRVKMFMKLEKALELLSDEELGMLAPGDIR